MKRKEITTRIEALEDELQDLRTSLEGPHWRKLAGDLVPIKSMDDKHLINSLRVCLRVDTRYTFDAERQRSFVQMMFEAKDRDIHHSRWIPKNCHHAFVSASDCAPEKPAKVPHALLPFDGLVRARLVSYKLGVSSGSGNQTASLTFDVVKPNFVDGERLYAHLCITGRRSDGKPNSSQLLELLVSAGGSLPDDYAVKACELLEDLVGKVAHLDVTKTTYNGQSHSQVLNFITSRYYRLRENSGTLRQTRRPF